MENELREIAALIEQARERAKKLFESEHENLERDEGGFPSSFHGKNVDAVSLVDADIVSLLSAQGFIRNALKQVEVNSKKKT